VSYVEKQPEPVKVEVSMTVRTVIVVSGKWIAKFLRLEGSFRLTSCGV
jgi:hypothetical protein